MPIRLFYRALFCLALSVMAGLTCQAQGREPRLAQLQNDWAMHYFDPRAHMALARYYLEHQKEAEAFFVLETARRGRFEEEVFDRAFQLAFEGFDTSEAAEARLLAERKQKPDDVELLFELTDIYIARSQWEKATNSLNAAIRIRPDDFRFTTGLAGVLRSEGKLQEAERLLQAYTRNYPESRAGYGLRAEAIQEKEPDRAKAILMEGITRFPEDGLLHFRMAAILQRQGNLDQAESSFIRAASLSPKSVDIQSWVGRFFFKVRKDNDRALPYYLSAYFCSPHAYESEYVESRIRQIYSERATTKFEAHKKAKKSLLAMLDDPDPIVVSMALKQVSESWLPEYVDPVLALMDHDDQGVRWQAMQVLKKAVDASFDQKLKSLLQDSDLRKRGLSAYIAVYRWKTNSLGFIDELLREKAELLRFDAISALMLEGGEEGKKRAIAHEAREPSEYLRKLIRSSKSQKSSP